MAEILFLVSLRKIEDGGTFSIVSNLNRIIGLKGWFMEVKPFNNLSWLESHNMHLNIKSPCTIRALNPYVYLTDPVKPRLCYKQRRNSLTDQVMNWVLVFLNLSIRLMMLIWFSWRGLYHYHWWSVYMTKIMRLTGCNLCHLRGVCQYYRVCHISQIID